MTPKLLLTQSRHRCSSQRHPETNASLPLTHKVRQSFPSSKTPSWGRRVRKLHSLLYLMSLPGRNSGFSDAGKAMSTHHRHPFSPSLITNVNLVQSDKNKTRLPCKLCPLTCFEFECLLKHWARWAWGASRKVLLYLPQKFQRSEARASNRLVSEAQIPFLTDKTKLLGILHPTSLVKTGSRILGPLAKILTPPWPAVTASSSSTGLRHLGLISPCLAQTPPGAQDHQVTPHPRDSDLHMVLWAER